MDAFYASVEVRDNPLWKGKPLVVGGSPHSRSVVCAASYEARKFGIRSAMSCYRAFQLCNEAVFVPPRFDAYIEVSKQIRKIFLEYTDLVEPLSLDEAYLDVTTNKFNTPFAFEIAKEIRKKIYIETQLTCSAGVSYNKFLAKMASEHNKPNGLFVIQPKDALNFLSEIPLAKFYGIGKKTAEKMRELGMEKGQDLLAKSESELINHFGKMGSSFFYMARGLDDRSVEPFREPKSIGAETTFEKDSSDFTYLASELQSLSEIVFSRLQKKSKKAKTVVLKIKNSEFQSKTRSFTAKDCFSSPDSIFQCSLHLLKMYWDSASRDAEKIRLLGIQCSHFQSEEQAIDKEPNLFSMDNYVRK